MSKLVIKKYTGTGRPTTAADGSTTPGEEYIGIRVSMGRAYLNFTSRARFNMLKEAFKPANVKRLEAAMDWLESERPDSGVTSDPTSDF